LAPRYDKLIKIIFLKFIFNINISKQFKNIIFYFKNIYKNYLNQLNKRPGKESALLPSKARAAAKKSDLKASDLNNDKENKTLEPRTKTIPNQKHLQRKI
jgi:hypothetical protein